MKKFSLFLSVCIIVGILFFALSYISDKNTLTSVRSYTQKDVITENTDPGTNEVSGDSTDREPPMIEIQEYKNKDIVTTDSVNIRVTALDNNTSSGDIIITGAGEHKLNIGYNPITVSAKDTSGNIAVKYIILERR